MFKKPLAHQSNATPLRSSARRQLLNAIYEQYPSLRGESQAQDGSADKELGRMILPEGVRIATFETSVGTEGTFWLTPDGDPLWMTFGRSSKEYIPTLYLLSLSLPSPPLATIQIHNPLPPPILTGAPLFIPAVRNLSKPWLLSDVQEGQLVTFVSSPSNGIEDVRYVGVGRVVAKGGMKGALERRIDNLQNEGGEKEEGKFADILCIIEDHLWELGSKPSLSPFSLPIPINPLDQPPDQASSPVLSETAIQQLSITDENPQPEYIPGPSSISSSSSEPLSSSEISTLLSISLLQALKSLQGSSFPLPASLLYSAHVLPNRPSYIPKERREEVVIAKSDWKKLTKWMKELGKDGLLKIKETKGEVIVQSFDSNHPSLQSHSEFTTIAQEEQKAAKKAAREAASNPDGEPSNKINAQTSGTSGGGVGKGKGKELEIEELWKPSGGAIGFWEAAGVDKSTLHHPSELKTALDSYLTKHSLIHPSDHRYVLLDDELGRAVGIKPPEPGDKMARDEVMKKLKSGVSWSVSLGGVIKKGTLQPITMTVKTRQGRKTVTHVYGLETFNIDPDGFAEEMRKVCAGSASIQPLPGASPKLNLQEVQIQGSQVKLITEALVGRGIPKRWIKESEDSKKKK
ncbi:translation initiation factor 2D [Kwoniella mangroviensis CBS 10435]|uniref:Translation initiation factor 2D n=1 Tax=Kwoniella mangroviensis CBS 10435 TaxID=1331196 RepID=A0A1B9IZK0_9TREE|nr:translation initiation factor 2D [Kwoniella mangroviensis CBS 8507]OCF60958.1 translation initiation factor 2D [Kwoniella mangroviensis CBS 10435]OCF66559.1 translation initiation factor 2D [Kwoniella mangroviensis CBS 8507]OCF74293.1 translation initiation factor 2D [Kwoniella mangroviensis CBS 8886]